MSNGIVRLIAYTDVKLVWMMLILRVSTQTNFNTVYTDQGGLDILTVSDTSGTNHLASRIIH